MLGCLWLQMKGDRAKMRLVRSSLTLVDLAGSERITKSGEFTIRSQSAVAATDHCRMPQSQQITLITSPNSYPLEHS
jgi:hypothetical protein